jgi:hypothetical protein
MHKSRIIVLLVALGIHCSANAQVPQPLERVWDPLRKLNSVDQAFLWMDYYCRANPLTNVSDGATRLYVELMLQ